MSIPGANGSGVSQNGVTHRGAEAPAQSRLVLSTFTGAGLMDRGFREEGFCVVSAGDALLGQPIQEFHAVKGHFVGVIGGPPCQKDSRANRTDRDPLAGMELKKEFFRVVGESEADWFLMEGVDGLPLLLMSKFAPPGYTLQRMHINARDLGFEQNRPRWYVFGYRSGPPLVIPYVTLRSRAATGASRCCLASEFERDGTDARTWADFCALQGVSRDFLFPPGLSRTMQYRLVGNGVHVGVARVLAGVIRRHGVTPVRVCVCECGREVRAGVTMATAACRKRMQRRREETRRDAGDVTGPGIVTRELSLLMPATTNALESPASNEARGKATSPALSV